ncbi:Bug family tripartite tricarboxylate transporter substrate binding protein [Halalkalicoccus jeotgali]|uniref:Bug family tripartite tricarboxylate transporter substrate binding protein n=1 Tax=Halalkalicoccus jeotgali TaxID=413810 RepID=UPI001EE64462|nr:tripartite tricarboxylate transporter substrate-binding protein [Halalkalicoccus jeotgali]
MVENGSTRRKFLTYGGLVGMGTLAGCAGGSNSGDSDEWTPDQNVRLIVPWGAGGGTDTAVRQVAQPAQELLSERDINVELNVENITGASGQNAATTVLNQPADGHTIFANTNVIAPSIAQGTDAFTLDDWAGIARMQYDTTWIFGSGRQGTGFGDIQELVDTAQSEAISFGISGGLDSAAFPVQFAQEAGFLNNLEIVAYDDAGRMENDVITGEIDCAYGELVELEGLVEEGEIELLYVGYDETVEGYEDVPNVEDTGWDAQFGTQRGLVVLNDTPQEAIDFWAELVQDVLETDAYQEFESANYLDIREGYLSGPEYMDSLQEMVTLFEETLSAYNP